MDYSTKFDTIKTGWSIVNVEVSRFLKSLSLKSDFVLASFADPDEILHSVHGIARDMEIWMI